MEQCTSKEYQDKVKLGIASVTGDAGAVICCQQDGCNWNTTVYTSGKSIGDFVATEEDPARPVARGLGIMTGPCLIHVFLYFVATRINVSV